jgi:hypothetical protein
MAKATWAALYRDFLWIYWCSKLQYSSGPATIKRLLLSPWTESLVMYRFGNKRKTHVFSCWAWPISHSLGWVPPGYCQPGHQSEAKINSPTIGGVRFCWIATFWSCVGPGEPHLRPSKQSTYELHKRMCKRQITLIFHSARLCLQSFPVERLGYA